MIASPTDARLRDPAERNVGQRGRATQSDPTTRDVPHRPMVCRSCATPITDGAALFGLDSDDPRRIFPNPYGQLREIITVRSAQNLLLSGPPTTDFTWFSGFAWEVAFCATCGTHLGWRFTAVHEPAAPHHFFGLLRSELVESKLPDS